ncbi:hypothetical protein MTBPR1_20234 [Candidatus Terasakiella magnetica]|uniref:Uncharacterized protein n=1 Tax=Candidatus Terasakiella magnetica TaxID=1867952 RepID=A0A1C3RGG2_9PROT|nr:hypothetical protein [Candidatus Terasakiella magnetica]SCA56386.1 hypothetical protein MTBPR1_20234 [Candidatus Terasakiella magnetica]
MFTTLSTKRANRYTHPKQETRTDELAHLLVNALGYDGAKEQAEQSHWEKVAETIRFMESQSLRRY